MNGPLLDAMIRACIQGSVLVALVWLICRIAQRRLHPAVRKALWWLVSLKMLVTLLWVTPPTLGFLPEASLPALPESAATALVAPATDSGASTGEAPKPQQSEGFPILAILWIAGVSLMGVRLAVGTFRLSGVTRRAMPIEGADAAEARRIAALHGLRVAPSVRQSNETTSPYATGWWRPTIVLPATFSALGEEERKMAIAHEIAHLKRGDTVLSLVPELARSLFFFLPPIWLACREWAAEREALCDQDALLATGAAPRDYREMLLKVASGDSRPVGSFAMGATAEFGLLRRRMEWLGRKAKFSLSLGALALVIAVPALVPWQIGRKPALKSGLLKNASFESGDNDQPIGWSRGLAVDGVTYAWDRSVGHTGHASLSIQKTTNRFFPIADWMQAMPLKPGATAIDVSAWVKAEKAQKAIIDVQFITKGGDGSHKWVAFIGSKEVGQEPATHGWKRMGGIAEIPAGTVQVIVSLQDYGPGKVWFDDVDAHFVKPAKKAGG